MPKISNIKLFYALGAVYIAGMLYVMLHESKLFVPYILLPLGVFLLYSAVFYTEKVVWFAVFITPLSVTLKELGLSEGHESLDLSLPSEPLFAGLLLLGIIYQLTNNFIDKRVLRHPITIIILVQFFWIICTTCTSSMPVVSIKFLIARLWFVCTGFFFAAYLYKKGKKNVELFLLLYLMALSTVVFITTFKHASLGFDDEVSDWIMTPFYNDHTAYGAAIAMFVPVSAAFILMEKKTKLLKYFSIVAFVLLIIGVYLSSARAAWLSLAAVIGFLITLLLKIKFRSILAGIVLLVGIFFIFQTEILILMGSNSADSEGHNADNISSMTNIKTDPSNVERLNRWNCALRMFDERPVVGWGPGTYILQYAPFQKKSERTIISNNDGSNGNAHSEYLGPLAEQGLPGTLIVVALFLSVFFTGYRIYYSAIDRNMKLLIAGILLGLATYFIHGFLNNFLDTDKLAIPFWGFIAALVCIDVYGSQYKDEAQSDQSKLM